jgi:hypothetical protein
MRRIEKDDTDYGIPDWVLEEERKAMLRGIAAEQKLWARKIKLNQRVREQSRCLRMTPLLFHGTWHLDAIFAEGCLTGAERVCFSRQPWPAARRSSGFARRRQFSTKFWFPAAGRDTTLSCCLEAANESHHRDSPAPKTTLRNSWRLAVGRRHAEDFRVRFRQLEI